MQNAESKEIALYWGQVNGKIDEALELMADLPHSHPAELPFQKAEDIEVFMTPLVKNLEDPQTQSILDNLFGEHSPLQKASEPWKQGIQKALDQQSYAVLDAELFGDEKTKSTIENIKKVLQKNEYEVVGGLTPEPTISLQKHFQELQNYAKHRSQKQAHDIVNQIMDEVLSLKENELDGQQIQNYWQTVLDIAQYCADHQIEAPQYRVGVASINNAPYPHGSEIPYEIERALQHLLKVAPPNESIGDELATLVAEQDLQSAILSLGVMASPSVSKESKAKLLQSPKLYFNGVESQELKNELDALGRSLLQTGAQE